MSLYQVETMDEAANAVRRDCVLAVITVGAQGCLVVTPDDVLQAPAQLVDQVLDTTRAGDLLRRVPLRIHRRRPLVDCASSARSPRPK